MHVVIPRGEEYGSCSRTLVLALARGGSKEPDGSGCSLGGLIPNVPPRSVAEDAFKLASESGWGLGFR